MRKNNIPRRTAAETQKIQFDKKPLSFSPKKNLSSVERVLFYAGILLYWAEGAKTGHNVVDFTNSNERMALIFLKMLRNIYRITEKKLRVLLYCYANQRVDTLVLHWSKRLNIPQSQFIKPYVRYDYNEKKTYKMPYGLVHIRYNDKRLFLQILKDIDIISRKLTWS